MATYEYLCLSCERPFEEQRRMSATVLTALACPSRGSERVRRTFSFAANLPAGAATAGSGGGCACGGSCACGGNRS